MVREPRASQKNNNQESFADNDSQDNYDNDLGLKSDDLEAVAVLYDCIRELFKEQDSNKDHTLADEFDEHVKHVMHDLTVKLNSKDSKSVMQTNVMKVMPALSYI